MTIEDFKGLMDAFEPSALLPELDSIMGVLEFAMEIVVLAGPVVLLVLGLLYLFAAPKEANYYLGYRCYFGMGSIEAWRFTQRLAGIVWSVLGILLTVIMAIISTGFDGKDTAQVISTAMTCIIWEVVLAAVSSVAINTIVALNFDSHGELRKKQPEESTL